MSWKFYDPNGAIEIAVPSIAASDIVGQVALANGGTHADLSATGGTGKYLKQVSVGANISVDTIASNDLAAALQTPPVIGSLSQSDGYFDRIRFYSLNSFYGQLAHNNLGNRVYTFPDYSATMATLAGAETLSNKKLQDSTVTIVDNSDPTKAARFEAGGITAGQTRVLTLQDVDGTIQFNAPGNFIPNSSFENWERGVSAAPDGWTLTGASATVAREATIVKHGAYSAKVTRSGTNCHLSADVYAPGGSTFMRGRTYTVGAWVYATLASRVRLRVNDGTTTTNSAYHTGGSAWEYLTCSFTVGGSVTALNVGLAVDTGDTSGYIDGITIEEGLSAPNYTPHMKPFNRFPRYAVITGRTIRQPAGTPGISQVLNTSQPFNAYWFNTTQALNDAFEFNVWMEAGTYTLSHVGVTSSTAGQITWAVDGVDQAGLTSVDWYTAGVVLNVTKTGTMTVIGDGYHVIRGKLAGKNGSSGGYNYFISEISIYPSAD